MFEHIPDPESWLWAGGGGILGRLMYRAKQAQSTEPPKLSWSVLLDLPIAIGMGFVGYGLSAWWSMSGPSQVIPIIACGYLGLYTIDQVFVRLLSRTKFKVHMETADDEYGPSPPKP